jgi:hypothetical protein
VRAEILRSFYSVILDLENLFGYPENRESWPSLRAALWPMAALRCGISQCTFKNPSCVAVPVIRRIVDTSEKRVFPTVELRPACLSPPARLRAPRAIQHRLPLLTHYRHRPGCTGALRHCRSL